MCKYLVIMENTSRHLLLSVIFVTNITKLHLNWYLKMIKTCNFSDGPDLNIITDTPNEKNTSSLKISFFHNNQVRHSRYWTEALLRRTGTPKRSMHVQTRCFRH